MRENLRTHWRIFDAGDHPEFAAAFGAGFDVDGEHALQALHPVHGGGRLVAVDDAARAMRHGIFPEGRVTSDGEIQPFKPGIDKLIAEQPVPVVPVALCNMWGSLYSRRDPLHKRRPYKLWARIELRIGKAIPPGEVNARRLQREVERLRGEDR